MEGDVVAGLVKQLVHRIFPSPKQAEANGERQLETITEQAFRYAMRIVGSRIVPSLANDEAAMAESIKRQLVMEGRSSDALTFADLHRRLAALSGPGSIENRWAILYLLRAISEDQRRERAETRGSAVPLTSTLSGPAAAGGLPVLPDSSGKVANGVSETAQVNKKSPKKGAFKVQSPDELDRLQSAGVLLLSKDSENAKNIALREFADLTLEAYEISEAALVRDVLYACQGIDGRFIKFDKEADGYIVEESMRVPRATRVLVRRLCEVGWLFKRVQEHISETLEPGAMEVIGTVGQALSAALQEELSDYYRLMAVLEAQLHNQIPFLTVGETAKSAGNYLSLRRLWVWLAEPLARMRLMAVLVDDCKSLRGGAMAGAIHRHAQHGDPLVRSFMGRLLRRVCSPLFEMVRKWVLEGEVDDLYGEFFIVAQPVKAEALWREGYSLQSSMLPSFIPEPLAQRILRTGKSINFLRVCCEDQEWATAAAEALVAAGASASAALGYGETEVLETLVVEAAGRIDQHLIKIIYDRYKFRDHCLAIKRYLLLGQGDFIQYLMDLVGPDLSQPANTVSSFKLAGLLESAIRALNAQYDDTEVLERLRVKMMPHNDGDRGWDVFSLEYNARDPLTTIFTEHVMGRYLRIFNFLWRLKRVEHALSATWQTMKPNCSLSRLWTANLDGGVKAQLVAVLRRCQTLRTEMNHFVTNLQYYIMFEVLEYSWANFLEEMEAAHDLDELIAAHEKYLGSIMEKALLGERSQLLSKTLFTLFDLILRFRGLADRLYENAREMQTRGGKSASRPQTGEFFASMGEEMAAIAAEYSSLLEGFIAQLPVQQHVDLKFLSFRLDFSEFYTRQHMHTPNVRLKIKRTATPKS